MERKLRVVSLAVKPGHEVLPVSERALSNRIRFPLEVLKRVKDAVGDFPVGYPLPGR
ncbi:MAG: hypothetical protein JRD84_06785 [Deltaproteobacteria bacterium]|nr:hypothetical protein [Deltaproteobacteria bacterium]